MKRKLFFAAVALVALASCTSDDFIGENNNSPDLNPGSGNESAIVFSSGTKAITRATYTGADAAEMLNDNFVFAGTKSSGTLTDNYVFDQYNAIWKQNTANTTLSNSNDWEYVGYTPATTSSITTNQTIKYWDYSKSQYDFAAYSLGDGDAEATAITFADINDDDPGSYTLTGTAENLKKCYISDLVTHYNNEDVNTFGKVVTFSFRSLAAKIRLAFFETVPGYAVKDIEFYNLVDCTNGSFGNSGTSSTIPTLLNAEDDDVLPAQNADNGVMTIFFPTTGWGNAPENEANEDDPKTDYNKAHVTFSGGTTSNKLTFAELDDFATTGEGALDPDDEYIGRTSNTATYAGGLDATSGTGTYYTILPNEDPENLMIRIKYTLVSADGSGEEIHVDNATAVIPAELARWSPNYAYTYIFKISDMTNGTTGVDASTGEPVMGLTPITLNAVVVDSEDGVQETITTVSEPSITTYMAGKIITENDEYIVNGTHPIYIVVNDGSNNVALTVNTNAKLYTVELNDDDALSNTEAINDISEKSVHNALRYGVHSGNTYTATDANGWKLIVTDVTDDEDNGLTGNVTTIPAAESPTGDAITLTCASFVPENTTGDTKYYVFQYIETAGVDGTYIPVVDGTTLTKGGTYYTSDRGAGKFVAEGTEVADELEGVNYWTLDPDEDQPTDGSYMYKIIKIADN